MADNFAQQVKAFRDKALSNVDAVVQDITVSVATSLVEKSPVDTGQLRANWQFGAGVIPDGEFPDTDPEGEETIEALTEAIKDTPAGGVTYLVNNLPYAPVIEYGLYPNPPKRPTGKTENGFSTQAPAGMRDITVMEASSYQGAAIQNL